MEKSPALIESTISAGHFGLLCYIPIGGLSAFTQFPEFWTRGMRLPVCSDRSHRERLLVSS